ncbi:MAG: hypothetical protein Q8O82_01870 [Pseudorhodobacter sp.]|nr:hypothetical protein [Pseudorhodobacter sp.]
MPGSGHGMPTQFFTFGPIMFLVFAGIIVIPFWMIFSKAGHSKWLSLLMVIPLVNVITLCWLAFSRWPSLREHC